MSLERGVLWGVLGLDEPQLCEQTPSAATYPTPSAKNGTILRVCVSSYGSAPVRQFGRVRPRRNANSQS